MAAGSMKKEYFDLLVVVPLEEELQQVMSTFRGLEDRCTSTEFRYIVDSGNSAISMMVVQQDAMGKGNAARAVSNALSEYDAGLIACLGIAGGMSEDLMLGDVCYTGNVIDVYDNSKALDSTNGDIDIEFSPSHFATNKEITVAFNFIRTLPEHKQSYIAWQSERETYAQKLLSVPVIGRKGREERIGRPTTKNGTIVCGAVSRSAAYNKKLQSL